MLRPAVKRTRQRRQIAGGRSIAAPVGGWDAVSSLVDMPEDRAIVLDNWFPSTGDVRVRRGYKLHSSGAGSSVVDSLLVYNGVTSATSKLFACANANIYDVTSAGVASSAVSGLANNRWQYTNFTTTAGKYLWVCNGADAPRHYNGSAWATPSLSVTTFSASDIVNVNAHQNRLWFVFKDSTVAGYLATGAIAGTVTNFQLGGLFNRGGHLVAMGTWTKDGGSGEDDLAVFISSRGQCAVYIGTDPASADTWSLVGVYDIGPPIGYRCFTKVAGDLALLCLDGVLPLSRALVQDRGASTAIALTKNINNAMNEAARAYSTNFGWEFTTYSKGTMAVLNVPIAEGSGQHQYVINTLTGAWCRFTGMDANCWAVFRDRLFFGGNAGLIFESDTGSTDLGAPIEAEGQSAYNYFGMPGVLKQWKMLQPLITTDTDSRPAIGLSTDFKDNASVGTPTAAASASATYDTAIYDTDVYSVESRSVADWTSVSGIGQCASIHFRAQTGSTFATWDVADWDEEVWYSDTGDVVMRLNGFNATFERGGFM